MLKYLKRPWPRLKAPQRYPDDAIILVAGAGAQLKSTYPPSTGMGMGTERERERALDGVGTSGLVRMIGCRRVAQLYDRASDRQPSDRLERPQGRLSGFSSGDAT